MKIIIEDRVFIEDLERLQYEVQARKNIIGYMISSNVCNDCFNQYHAEYLDLFKRYEQKKEEVDMLYVRPAKANAKSWSLDFKSGELKID